MSDETEGRFCSILPPFTGTFPHARVMRAPSLGFCTFCFHNLHTSPPEVMLFRLGIISPTFQKKRRRFLEKRWSFSKKCRSFFHISRMFFLCWSDTFWKTLLSFFSIFDTFFHCFSSVFLEKRDSHPKNPS